MKLARCHIVAVMNQKGGCGKTTTVVNLAAACALKGYTVVVVDTDQQCDATSGFGLNLDELINRHRAHTILDAYIARRPATKIAMQLRAGDEPRLKGNLYIVPGHRGLSQVTPKLDAELHSALAVDDSSELDADDIRTEHRHRLADSIDTLRDCADLILIDCPPALGFHTTSALIAADSVIITVFPSGYDLNGLKALEQTMTKVKQRYNHRLDFMGVLLGNRDPVAKVDRQILRHLKDEYKSKVFDTTISRSVRHREGPLHGKTIFEQTLDQKPKDEFTALAVEMLGRIGDYDLQVENVAEPNEQHDPVELTEVNR